MKIQIALISLLALASTFLFFSEQNNTLEQNYQQDNLFKLYSQWKTQFNKNTNGSEDQYRFAIWSKNYEFVKSHNSNNKSLKLAMNQLSDLSLKEYKAMILTRTPHNIKNSQKLQYNSKKDTPASVNWVKEGKVSPIKNQGNCGSCWAFSAIASLESLHAIAQGNLVQFSEQQLTSCDQYSLGCNGGNEFTAMGKYTPAAGLETEQDYPYQQENNPITVKCQYEQDKTVWKNGGAREIESKNPDAMKQQLAEQPISIAVDAGNIYFQLYSSGVLDSENCGVSLDHAINIVGYDTTDGDTPYWIIRNSWGSSWGMGGYAHFAITEGAGVCGCQLEPVYPTA